MLTLQGALGTFFRKNCLKTSSKLVWRLSSLFLDTFENSIFFRFFLASFTNFDLQVALGKKSSKKLPQASLNTFDNVFRDFEFLKSFRFLCIFLSLQGSLGRAFFRRNNQAKHAQTMFLGTFLENFESFELLFFFKFFPSLDPPGCTGDFFSKEIPQNRFRTCLDNITDSFGHLRNIEIFHFFQSFPYSTLQVALGKNFCQKTTSKHVQNMFDCFWERFFRHFEQLKVFPVFWGFSKFRPSRVHWTKNFDKITSKLVWTLLVTFLDTFEISN